MTTGETVVETYRARLEMDSCYTVVSAITQEVLEHSMRRNGLQPFDRVAHGVLAFCLEEGTPVCLPWLVAPDAPDKDIIGGRHGLVINEFYDLAEENDLGAYTNGGSTPVDYDDQVKTYVVRDDRNKAQFTVICDSLIDDLATPTCIELVEALSFTLPDHQFLLGLSAGETPTSYWQISEGSASEVAYGFMRGYVTETIAPPEDILGRIRELESYAQFAERHGLKEFEFGTLVSRAVQAFKDHRQVGLGTLCEEVIAMREIDD